MSLRSDLTDGWKMNHAQTIPLVTASHNHVVNCTTLQTSTKQAYLLNIQPNESEVYKFISYFVSVPVLFLYVSLERIPQTLTLTFQNSITSYVVHCVPISQISQKYTHNNQTDRQMVDKILLPSACGIANKSRYKTKWVRYIFLRSSKWRSCDWTKQLTT